MIQVDAITLLPQEPMEKLMQRAEKKLGLTPGEIVSYQILKESLDARKKGNIFFRYSLTLELKQKNKETDLLQQGLAKPYQPMAPLIVPKVQSRQRPVVVGFGPAGMFCALILSRAGLCPLVVERGEDVDQRTEAVEDFWHTGRLNPESNVQFGEGGAGTFSDGKLTARTKDSRSRFVLETFVSHGAPEEILYSAFPHIGTDRLRSVVKNLRQEILSLGGEIRFGVKLMDLHLSKGCIQAVALSDGSLIPTDCLILALGHSARDTFSLLEQKGFAMEPKPFAMGVRIEHRQEDINQMQFGALSHLPRLIPASYRLTAQTASGRGVYTFCMCPGGTVVAAASEPGRLCTNGMSYHARDGENANSALLVQVSPADYPGNDALAGMRWQQEIEQAAYQAGGGGYVAPAQRVEDFFAHRKTEQFGAVTPSYRPGVRGVDLHAVLPQVLCQGIREGLMAMEKKCPGFCQKDAVLTAVESRSSSPVRLLRQKDTLQAVGISGVYPIGEGAGYAGGIVSAAVDGIRAGQAIIDGLAGKTKFTRKS